MTASSEERDPVGGRFRRTVTRCCFAGGPGPRRPTPGRRECAIPSIPSPFDRSARKATADGMSVASDHPHELERRRHFVPSLSRWLGRLNRADSTASAAGDSRTSTMAERYLRIPVAGQASMTMTSSSPSPSAGTTWRSTATSRSWRPSSPTRFRTPSSPPGPAATSLSVPTRWRSRADRRGGRARPTSARQARGAVPAVQGRSYLRRRDTRSRPARLGVRLHRRFAESLPRPLTRLWNRASTG